MVHVGCKGTTKPIPVRFDTQAGCPYFPLTHQSDLANWWQNTLPLGTVDALPRDFTITCSPNPNPAPRMDSIIILGGGSIQTFTILQDACPPTAPTWNNLVDSYTAFITAWLLRFWWNNPVGPPFSSTGLGNASERQIRLAKALQMMVSGVENKEARKLVQEAARLIAKAELKKLK